MTFSNTAALKVVRLAFAGASDTLATAVAAAVSNEATLTSDPVKESLSRRFRSDTWVIPLVILGLFMNIEACANAGALTMDGALVRDGAFTIDGALVSGAALMNDDTLVSGAAAALSIISMALSLSRFFSKCLYFMIRTG